jgi:hypothetical protein
MYLLFYDYSIENMQKKLFTYKEAIKAILYFLGVIIMIESNYVLVRGRIDNRQGDLNFTRHNTDAAPLILNIPNYRKNNTLIGTSNEKIICCNRKDPTFFGFLRYSGSSPTIETQISIDQNGNKIYFNDSKTPKIDLLVMFDKLASSFFGILYKILFDCGKNNEKHQTSQNKKRTTQPSIVALRIRIKGPKFILKRDCLIFSCISAIMLDETKISEKYCSKKTLVSRRKNSLYIVE